MDIGLDSKTDKTLVSFPWPTSNMKKIESCIKSKPLFSHFSLSQLEETKRPYQYLIDKSMMQGAIIKSVWQQWPTNHWLSTAAIQLLSALMMRNTTENKFVHVFSPTITKMMQESYQFYDQFKHKGQTMDLSKKLKGHLHHLRDYIECVGDLFEHKFLVFLCNCSNFHWITFIMVNPSVIYLRGDSTKTELQ